MNYAEGRRGILPGHSTLVPLYPNTLISLITLVSLNNPISSIPLYLYTSYPSAGPKGGLRVLGIGKLGVPGKVVG